ncbi:MAG: ATP-dependent zinc metalloprotease FtsH [Lachnospiraceae bacterium]|nr:ATP-dependent zinc metalloprotease FtsH [Lachnospiraceae bacterium]
MLITSTFSRNRIGRNVINEVTYGTFVQAVESGDIRNVEIAQNSEVPTGTVTFVSGGTTNRVNVSDVNAVEAILAENEVDFTLGAITSAASSMRTIFPVIIIGGVIVMMVVMMSVMMRAQGGVGGNPMMNFGKSKAKMVQDVTEYDFSKVAGLDEEKEALQEIVEFLKSPEKFTRVGARIPKGVLLVGPPGTGKTLLAKAVAGEGGVPFFSISGSDFVEMFVGVGASRVRDLFTEAKQNAPCIVFIDEIDAVARRRGTGMGGGHDEREQTLNQLLVEMDGFGANEGIIVMAATNRVDILDPAIMRPGRFDRKVGVGKPDVRGREEILKVHARNKPLAEDVNLEEVAQTTAGFTGADLENLMNEAAIGAAKQNRGYVKQADINKALIKVGIGEEKRSKIISEKDKRITAYHETGHAILFHVLPDVGPVHMVSVIPTGMGAAGYTMPLPSKDETFMTKGIMRQNIMVSLGGRIAEELVLEDVTTGASQDIKQATNIARAMVTQYGMSEKIGMISYGDGDEDVFIGLELGQGRKYGEDMAGMIDSEVKRIIDECYDEAKDIISHNMDVLHAGAELLMEKEKITGAEFEALFGKNEQAALPEGAEAGPGADVSPEA